MNLPEHKELWNNIQQFVFDEPNATITFSKKLAGQQKWSPSYTEGVIEEYRKFIFLCCISPKGAAPSKAVDEAWHLHLTYTQSYWNAFCKNTLGKDIHHYPSSGGEQENHRHTNWYNETLNLYVSVFGAPPPAGIWPQPGMQLPAAEQSSQLRPQTYRFPTALLIVVYLLLLLPFVSNYYMTGIASPFSLNGPQFLLFYAILGLAVIIVHYLLRKEKFMHLEKWVDAWSMGDMTIFQLTHFVHGKERAVETSLVDLYRRELVSVDDTGTIVVHSDRYKAPDKEENPLIPALLNKADGSSVTYDAIAGDWYKKQLFTHPAIDELFSLTDQKESWFQKNIVLLFALLIGLARVMQGWMNDRPVVFLFLEIIALAVIVGIITFQLSTNELAYYKLKALLLDKAGSKQLHTDEVINDYALNGRSVLGWLPESLMLGAMFATFPGITAPRPLPIDNASSGNDVSSGDSSGGSGSSCGGGGCGGCGGGED
jgi:uncharacterized protein (TIGR04222 family)